MSRFKRWFNPTPEEEKLNLEQLTNMIHIMKWVSMLAQMCIAMCFINYYSPTLLVINVYFGN